MLIKSIALTLLSCRSHDILLRLVQMVDELVVYTKMRLYEFWRCQSQPLLQTDILNEV